MKFYISRTSDGNFNEETPPIPGIVGESLKYIQEFYGGKEEMTRTVWPIEIQDIAALMALVKEEGPVVIQMGDSVFNFGPRIIIYDDYME